MKEQTTTREELATNATNATRNQTPTGTPQTANGNESNPAPVRINTPRGNFKVSAIYRKREEARAAGFEYYFTNDDGREIFTKHDDPARPFCVTAFAVVDKNAPAPVEETTTTEETPAPVEETTTTEETPAPVEETTTTEETPATVEETTTTDKHPAPVHIYRDEARRVFAIYADGSAKRLDNLETMNAREILEIIADSNGTNKNETTRQQAREILYNIEREEKKEQTERENFEHCRAIADELDEIAAGRLIRCPHCGAEMYPDYDENDDGETVLSCRECGEVFDEDDGESVNIFDYFRDCLDIEYITDSRGNYKSVRVCVACGGPHIEIDTDRGAVVLTWWTETARAYLSTEARDMVDEFGQELFNCL